MSQTDAERAATPRPGDPVRAHLRMAPEAQTPQAETSRRDRLQNAASRIRDRDYQLSEFHADMVMCFPELNLYLGGEAVFSGTEKDVEWSRRLLQNDPQEVEKLAASAGNSTSGRSSLDEYKRTWGALFAVYWLCRLELPEKVAGTEGLGGQLGFCFGVKNELTWQMVEDPVHEITDTTHRLARKQRASRRTANALASSPCATSVLGGDMAGLDGSRHSPDGSRHGLDVINTSAIALAASDDDDSFKKGVASSDDSFKQTDEKKRASTGRGGSMVRALHAWHSHARACTYLASDCVLARACTRTHERSVCTYMQVHVHMHMHTHRPTPDSSRSARATRAMQRSLQPLSSSRRS